MKDEDVEVGNVSPSGCAMYQALADKLHLMEKRLSSDLFVTLWQTVASQITVVSHGVESASVNIF